MSDIKVPRKPTIWLDAGAHVAIELIIGEAASTCARVYPDGPRLEEVAHTELALYPRAWARTGEGPFSSGLLSMLAAILTRDLPRRDLAALIVQQLEHELRVVHDYPTIAKHYNSQVQPRFRIDTEDRDLACEQLKGYVKRVIKDILDVNKERAKGLLGDTADLNNQIKATKAFKAEKPAKAPKRPKPNGKTQKDRFIELIMAGELTEAEIFKTVQAEYGLDDGKKGYVKWYWKHLTKEGRNPPPLKGASK